MEEKGFGGQFVEIQQPMQQPSQADNQAYQKAIQDERVANFMEQSSPTKTLSSIDYILRGYMYDKVRQEWKKVSEGIPDRIRLDFLQVLTSHLTEDARMTCLQNNQINGIMEFLIEWVVDYLDNMADEYNLKEEQMTKIALIMLNSVYYTILRAREGIERIEIFDSLRIGESLSLSPSQPQQSSSDWWKFWK